MMDTQSILSFFTDPILRAPTIGCMLMCLTAGLMGTIVFLRKQSLVGETLSHASYPGIILGLMLSGMLAISTSDPLFVILTLTGAFLSGLLGLWVMHLMERHLKVSSDAALCFVLAAFFSVGITLASEIQFSFTTLYKQSQTYLYGQAATMTDRHIVIYGILACLVLITLFAFYKELQVMLFDPQFARTIGLRTHSIDGLLFVLIVLAVIVGIRSVGVVLMSGMLIMPPAAARQFTNRLSILLGLSGLFGLLSGFFGNYFSVILTDYLAQKYPQTRLALPTGPMIILVASLICFLALFFAPERGLILRFIRAVHFRYKCIGENVLKALWRLGPQNSQTWQQLNKYQSSSRIYLTFILWRLKENGWIKKSGPNRYQLTPDGEARAAKIVRLHRLWEVYLVDYLGVKAERVHRNAEEMEHILTPELEKDLSKLLNDPKHDPHHQPIPPQGPFNVF